MDYQEFIDSKQRKPKPMGFEVDKESLNPRLFQWQRDVVHWALKRGRAALFEETGHGKSFQQLVWSEQVHKHTNKPVIIHCPLGVRQQTEREAIKFGIDCKVAVVNDQSEVVNGINLVNYEKLHHFDASLFAGVVLDESQILKAFTGKTKRQLCEFYSQTPYRLACTATPAPNDHMELGNQSEFLGIMPSNEMLSRWFINDTMKAGGYRLRGHAQNDFWDWVASWAVCISKPSDVGGSDDGFVLPKLNVQRHVVVPDQQFIPEGMLFATGGVSATKIHEEKRASNSARARKTAELVASNDSTPWLIWCNTNYEADELKEQIPYAVEVRGSDSESVKESKLSGFSKGDIRVLISKPSLSGLGMNWQHCHNTVFAGLSFSFEEYYQAVRRFYRFGQVNCVNVHIVLAESDTAIDSVIARKESDHLLMQSGMSQAMKRSMLANLGIDRAREKYVATKPIVLPPFLKSKGLVNAGS